MNRHYRIHYDIDNDDKPKVFMKCPENTGFGSFRRRLFAILAAGTLFTVISLTILWMGYAWLAVSRSVQRDLRLVANRTASEMDQFLSDRTSMLLTARELLSYPDEDYFKLELMLRRLSLEFGHFKELTLYDASYKPIASSNSEKTAVLPNEAVEALAHGKIYRSSLLFTKGNLPYMRLIVPVFWQGEVFRVLEGHVDIMPVWNKIDHIEIGNTGRALILSKEGTFIADRDKRKVLFGAHWNEMMALPTDLSQASGSIIAEDRLSRTLYISFAEIPSTEWKLVVLQERGEALHFLTVLAVQAAVLVAVMLIVAYPVSSWLAQKVSRPIEELCRGAVQIGRGNFAHRLPPLEGTDMAHVGDVFNNMAKSLAEKEEMEKKLAQAEKMAAVGRLAADVSHEINNPLAIIKNYLYVVGKQHMKEDDPNQRYVKTIDREVDRIARILRSFSDLYKGTREIQLIKVEALEPLREVIDFFRLESETNGIRIETAVDGEAYILGNRDKLKQVYINLIKNAVEAMGNDGVLTVEARKEHGSVLVFIKDTGPGIRPEHLSKLFTPFFSTKDVKGTGLGLSVSYGIISNFSGNIEVKSELGKGTVFKVRIPLAED